VLNFTLLTSTYPTWGALGKIGLYQDVIALASGTVFGEILAKLADAKREELEIRQSRSLLHQGQTPLRLRIMRTAKVELMALAPLFAGMLLAIRATPNTAGDYVAKLAVGSLYGAQMTMLLREFENLSSYLHFKPASEQPDLSLQTRTEKVKNFAARYFPSILFLGAMSAFFGWAAATNSLKVDGAIITLLLSTYTSFILTDRLAAYYRPDINQRVKNELAFRFMYASIGLSIPYQYLTTKLDIGDQGLQNDSNEIYILSLVTWCIWGIVVGNNRAMDIQRRPFLALPLTPPIAIQELSKTFISNLYGPS
jgi:hypothetical protein